MKSTLHSNRPKSRRDFLRTILRAVCLVMLGWLASMLGRRYSSCKMSWQIDPRKCIACGKCSNACVLTPSAVKCMHAFKMCGYCNLCTGYFTLQANSLDTGAENQLCPVGAIKRRFVEDPFYEYTIDDKLCVACGRCVKGCGAFGNGSLYLQVRHDRCVNCNECAIARACPSGAFRRVPVRAPYMPKDHLLEQDWESHVENKG